MEQGFPPGRMLDSTTSVAVVLTHCLMVPALAVIVFLAFQSLRRTADKKLVNKWGRTLIALVGLELWIVVRQSLRTPGQAESVFAFYLAIAVLIGVVAMQGCDFRCWKQTKTTIVAFVLSCLSGFRRVLFILAGAASFSILPAMMMPSPSSAREPARIAQCRNDMRQLGLAMQYDIEANGGKWPRSIDGKPPVSWRVHFLPYMDLESLRKRYDKAHSWDDSKNLPVAKTNVSAFICQANPYQRDDQPRYFTSFLMLTGPGSAAPGDRDIRYDDFRDGITNTAVFVEAAGLNVIWTEPRDADVTSTPIGINLKGSGKTDSPGVLSSYHTGRSNMTLADGSVRTINEHIDPQVLKSLTTIAGQEELPSNWDR